MFVLVMAASLVLWSGRPSASMRSFKPAAASLATAPPLILYSWERAEDLAFLDPRKVGVAFLASTLYLRGDEVAVRPRLNPLVTAPGAWCLAVVRIETVPAITGGARPALSPGQRQRAAAVIAQLSLNPRVRGVQIDFDATPREREFYGLLLGDVRQQLPQKTALSITALASWCAGDDWLEGLAIDEAVPMLYRMGADRRVILRGLQTQGGFTAPACRASLAISTDEPLKRMPRAPHLYVFNPAAWTEASFEKWTREVKP
jgi:hypothetical protein